MIPDVIAARFRLAGRASLAEFLRWTFFTWLAVIVIGLTTILLPILRPVGLLALLVVLASQLAVTVRRLHDTGRSGAMILSISAAAVASSGIDALVGLSETLNGAISLLTFAGGLYVFFLCIQPTSPEPNGHGPPPR